MKHVETVLWILLGADFIMAIILFKVLKRMKKDDIAEINDDTDYQDAERPFIDNLN